MPAYSENVRSSDIRAIRQRRLAQAAMGASGQLLLFGWRLVVERLAFIDDVHRQKLHRLVAHDLESTVRNIPDIHSCNACWEGYLLAVWKLNRAAFQDVKRLLAMMD